jgi:transketolase
MNKYEKFLIKEVKKKNTFILTAENLLAIRNLGRKNILDVGICEQSLIGVAAGIAKNGGKCYVHALSNFLISRSFEFLKIDLDYNNCNCVLIGSMGGIQSTFNGPTHQSIDEMSILENFSTFDIFFPMTVDEMVNILAKFKFNKTIYVRFNPKTNKEIGIKKTGLTNSFLLKEGKNLIVSNGIIISYLYELLNQDIELKKKYSLYNFSYVNKKKFSTSTKKILQYDKILVIEDHLENGSIHHKLSILISQKKHKNKLKSINFGKKYFSTNREIIDIIQDLGLTKKNLSELKI